MSAGLRTIQSNARSYSNRARRDHRILRKAREAHAEVGSLDSVDLPPPVPHVPHPAATEVGAAFPDHERGQPAKVGRNLPAPDAGSRSTSNIMPPPPYIPASRPPFRDSLPPVTQVSFGGYLNGRSRPAAVVPDPQSANKGHHSQSRGGSFRGPGF